MTEIRPYLERVRERFSDPKVHDSFKTFDKTLLFEFPDTRQFFSLIVVAGEARLEEQATENPHVKVTINTHVKVTINTDVLAGIMDRKVNPITAYMTRKIKVQDARDDLLKLQKLLF